MKHIFWIGLLAWSTAYAVELGSVSLTSTSEEPLRAQIPILLQQNESLEQLSASILETNPNTPDIMLSFAEGPTPHIKLSSKTALSMPELSITLQISDQKEENEYHYDISFDTLKSDMPGRKPMVYGPIKSGDTLWKVANAFAKHYQLTLDQSMAALYEHNKKAFVKGEGKQLLAGSYLKLPDNINKTLTPTHAATHFKPTEVITQQIVMTEPQATPEPLPVVTQALAPPTVIPEFPSMQEGKQVAMNTLKLLNPLTDANTALFSNTLTTVLGAEDTAFVKLLDKMQQDLKVAREAIDFERQSKQALESQIGELQVQLKALTELVSLQAQNNIKSEETVKINSPFGKDLLNSLFFANGIGNNPVVLLLAAVAMASLLMYAWDHFNTPKPETAKVSAKVSIPSAVRAQSLKPKLKLPSLNEVDQFIQHGRYHQAQEMLTGMLAKQPGDFDALFKLCQVYVKSDNRIGYETKLNQISQRWRTMYPDRYTRLMDLYAKAWSSSRVAHDGGGAPIYEGDPPSDPVQTKLDLARAYIDIGDQASAYEILAEVLKEGNPTQVMSAQALMGQISPR